MCRLGAIGLLAAIFGLLAGAVAPQLIDTKFDDGKGGEESKMKIEWT